MQRVRLVVNDMAHSGELEVVQKGARVHPPEHARGPIRLRMPIEQSASIGTKRNHEVFSRSVESPSKQAKLSHSNKQKGSNTSVVNTLHEGTD